MHVNIAFLVAKCLKVVRLARVLLCARDVEGTILVFVIQKECVRVTQLHQCGVNWPVIFLIELSLVSGV